MLQPEPWLDPRVRPHVDALAGPDGLAVEGRIPVGLPWQEPDESWSVVRAGWTCTSRSTPSAGPPTGAATSTPSTATGRSSASAPTAARDGHSTALAAGDREVLAALLHAEQDPAGLSDAEYLALLGADGTDLDALTPSPTPSAPTSTATTSPTS